MDLTALLLSRIQFAFTVSFHIIFPSFTIGLAAWLTVLEALRLATGRPAYRLVFEFWLKIFGVAFGLGVVSGIVMAFQFGTNWSVLSRMSGPIQGPLLSYETFTAFFLEASFFGILLFGRPRRAAVVLLVLDGDGGVGNDALRLLDHGQQQLDAGAGRLRDGERPVCAERLGGDHLQPGRLGALPAHAAGLVPDRRVLRRRDRGVVPAARRITTPRRASCCAWACSSPPCWCRRSCSSDTSSATTSHDKQPVKFAAIEARWHDEQPASEVLIALPDDDSRDQPLRDQRAPSSAASSAA